MGFEIVQGSFLERLPSISLSHGVVLVLSLFIVHQTGTVLYRLFFSPLAKYPGSKLAAVSYWYEYYWDVTRKGRYIFKIQELHEHYGPLVRINPNELHINDPDFFSEIYHGNKWRTNRDRWYTADFLGEGLAFTIDHDLHAIRRHALSPYFSMQSIRALEPRITIFVEHMAKRLHQAYEDGSIVDIYHLSSAYALDAITEYAFGNEGAWNLMSQPELAKEWCDVMTNNLPMNPFARQFKTLMRLVVSIPESIMARMSPDVAFSIRFWNSLLRQVKWVQYNKDNPLSKYPTYLGSPPRGAVHNTKDEPITVFHELVNSSLPEKEKSPHPLKDEASMIVSAGGETTAQVLSRTIYHLIANPTILKRLRDELQIAIPDSNVTPSLQTLQKLPYLSAVVEEGVRISLPVPARSPREFPDHTLQFKQWTIEPGTAVSTSPYVVSTNSAIFPEPFKFKPERRLDNKELLKYAVNFGKGRRGCLGKNLAYAELWLVIAVIFRKFELELYETTLEDVTIVHDFFLSSAKQGSKGVRARIVGVRV